MDNLLLESGYYLLLENGVKLLLESADPLPPSHLTATADGGYSTISLKWNDNSSDETGFKIDRSSNGLDYVQIGTAAAGATYYRDTGLTRGNTYYYKVRSYNADGNSTYTMPSNDTVFQLSDVGTPYLQLDADTDVYSDAGSTPAEDADNVQEWHDQSGNGRNVTQTTAAAKPVYQTSEINGHNVLRFAAGDMIVAASAADWKFLHDGSAFTTFIVWKTTSTNTNTLMALYDTGALAVGQIGQCLFADDRSASSRDEQMVLTIANGGGAFEYAEVVPHLRSVSQGAWHVSSTHRVAAGDATIDNDGHWGGSVTGSPVGSPSAANPTSALTIGARLDNTFNLVGDIAYVLMYDSYLSETDYRKVTQYLGDRFAQKEYYYFDPAQMVVEMTGETYDYAICGGLTVAPNGNLIMCYVTGKSHTTDWDYVYVMISSDKGATWGAPIEIWDFFVDGGSTDYFIPQFFTVLADGRILLHAGMTDTGGLVTDGLVYMESDDNGATWTGPTQVPGVGTDHNAGLGGPIVELANGDLLFPYRYQNTGDGTLIRLAISKSEDGGDTWAAFADITNGTAFDEPGIVLLANGDLLCTFRDDSPATPRTLRFTVSDDSGSTWGAVTYCISGWGPTVPMLLDDDMVLSPMRYPYFYDTKGPFLTLTSPDGGVRWQNGHEFERSPNAGTGYPMYGQYVQDMDGTIYVAYAIETDEGDSGDLMFTKAIRGTLSNANLAARRRLILVG